MPGVHEKVGFQQLAAVVLKSVVNAKTPRLAVANELDELVEQWPRNQQQTVAWLAVRGAFFNSGAVHWAEEQVPYEDPANEHAPMLYQRQLRQRFDPAEELLVLNSVRLPNDATVVTG